MRFRLMAFVLLLTLALQPAFAAVCLTSCATPMSTAPAMHHHAQAPIASHHHHHNVTSDTTSAHPSMVAAPSCGKKLEVAAQAAPVPHVELLPNQTTTFVLTSTNIAVALPPERSVASSVPLHVPLRI